MTRKKGRNADRMGHWIRSLGPGEGLLNAGKGRKKREKEKGKKGDCYVKK